MQHIHGSHIIYIAATFAFVVAAASCATSSSNPEEPARIMLSEARELLISKDYAAARDTIMSLRQQHPTALQTRRAAILTLDSIELMEVRDSLAIYEQQMMLERERFSTMKPRIDGRTNDEYYSQQRLLMHMEQHYDELCAKVKFFVRKIDIDSKQEN